MYSDYVAGQVTHVTFIPNWYNDVTSSCNDIVFFFLQTERDSLKLQCQTLQEELEKNNEAQVRINMSINTVCKIGYFVVHINTEVCKVEHMYRYGPSVFTNQKCCH